MDGSRRANGRFTVPLYRPPVGLAQRKPWCTRQEIDTLAPVQAALRGREIAYLADPIDALIVQIQGSARLRIAEPDGTQRKVLDVSRATALGFRAQVTLEAGLARTYDWFLAHAADYRR